MTIELLYFADCPSFPRAAENLEEALRREGLTHTVRMTEVVSAEDAIGKRFLGSPSIRIDGVDVEGPEAEGKVYGYGCRVYARDGSLNGWPSVEQIRAALRVRRQP